MAEKNTLEVFFEKIANTIRYKKDEPEEIKYKPSEMPNAIKNIDKTKSGTFVETSICNVENGIRNIEKIVVSDTVETIKEGAYKNCLNLNSAIFLGDVKTIEKEAFYYCSKLTNIDIPNSVETVGLDAFTGTPYYNNLGPGLVYIGKALYKYKPYETQQDTVTINESDSPNGIASISERAFYGSKIINLVINANVLNIYGEAFYDSNLKSITINNDNADIGVNLLFYSLRYTYANSLYVGYVESTQQQMIYGANNLKTVYFKKIKNLNGNQSFNGAPNLEKFRADHIDTMHGYYLFRYNTNLKTIIILNENTLPSIEPYAFSYLSSAVKIYVHPNMVEKWQEKFNSLKLTNEIIAFNEEDGIW